MIERESAVKVYSEALGVKGAKGRLVRVAPEGYYEVTLEASGRSYTTLLPVATTVIMAADAEEEIGRLDIER